MDNLKQAMRDVLEKNILNYWIDHVTDHENGGYYGRVDGREQVHPEAEKGAIMNARILWAFSAAYRVIGKPEYLEAATRAKNYVRDHFLDKEQGGVFWSVDYKGNPLDTKKQTYAIGFTIYGMSEYARATGDKEALDIAISLYHDIENHAFDSKNNGYIEALTRDWQPIADMRLSDKDENGSRTMNTHLHIIEPYTNLYRVWKTPELEKSIRNLLDIFTDKLLNKQTYHLDLFFNDEWEGKRNIESFGHDIEASWLLHETALVLGDKQVLQKIEKIIRRIADAADVCVQTAVWYMNTGRMMTSTTCNASGGCSVRISSDISTFTSISVRRSLWRLPSSAGTMWLSISWMPRMESGTGQCSKMVA